MRKEEEWRTQKPEASDTSDMRGTNSELLVMQYTVNIGRLIPERIESSILLWREGDLIYRGCRWWRKLPAEWRILLGSAVWKVSVWKMMKREMPVLRREEEGPSTGKEGLHYLILPLPRYHCNSDPAFGWKSDSAGREWPLITIRGRLPARWYRFRYRLTHSAAATGGGELPLRASSRYRRRYSTAVTNSTGCWRPEGLCRRFRYLLPWLLTVQADMRE